MQLATMYTVCCNPGIEDRPRQDSKADDGSSLGPFPEHKEWSTRSGRWDDAESRASTGGMSSGLQPLVRLLPYNLHTMSKRTALA